MSLKIRLDKSQRKELGKYFFDLSKIVLGSLVLKFFEPSSAFSLNSLLTLIPGLTGAVLLVILGLRLSKEKK